MSKGIKPIERRRDVLDGDPPLVIVECECGNNTIARRPTASTLRGWLVKWPAKTHKMMKISGVCPKCASMRA